MFKYILLCSLLAHSIWAKPVDHQHHVEVAPHVVIVTPQAQLSLESLVHGTPIIHHTPFIRFIGPHEESIVYVPASALHHNEIVSRSFEGTKGKQLNPLDLPSLGQLVTTGTQGLQTAAEQAGGYISGASQYIPGNPAGGIQSAVEGLYQGIGSYIQGQAQAQQQLQQQQNQQQQQQQLLIQQQQKIQQLEQKLQPQKQPQLIAIETPLISAGLSLPASTASPKLNVETPIISAGVALPGTDLLNVVAGSVGSVGSVIPNLLSPLVKQKSLSVYGNEPGHHYFVEQPHHHVIEYIPGSLVLSPLPITTTVKARRSILAEDKEENKYQKETAEDIKPAEDEKIIAAPSAESLNAAPENLAAIRSVKADDSEEKKESKDFAEEENKPAEGEKEAPSSSDAANPEPLDRQRRWANKAHQREEERKTNYDKNRKPVLSKEEIGIPAAY